MSELFESRDIVVPGDVIYKGRTRTGDNTYRFKGNVCATRIGLVNYGRGMVSVIALEAGYNPLIGDIVVGEVRDINLGSWTVNIDAPTEAVLNVPDAIDGPFRTDMVMPEILDVGETIVAISILGSDLGKVDDGFIIRITPSKIPRLIGKKGSMVNMILKETGCQLTIGQNGRVLVQCRTREQEEIVLKVICKVEDEAHTTGLTNRVQEFIKDLKK